MSNRNVQLAFELLPLAGRPGARVARVDLLVLNLIAVVIIAVNVVIRSAPLADWTA